MSESVSVVVGIDFSEMTHELREQEGKVEQFTNATKRTLIENSRKIIQGARLALYTTQAITGAIDETLFSIMEAGFLVYEELVAIATAESITVVGAIKAGLTFAAAIGILVQVRNVQRGRDEIAQRQGQGIQAIRAATTFVGG